MDVIQCYAPCNTAEDEEKEQFYERLGTIIEKLPRRNMLIVMGDVNAMIGDCNEGYEEIMGKEGLGEMNNNGERFVDFCATHNHVIGGNAFKHKRIHKATWTHPKSKPHKCEQN